jgi:hypothetical protein
MLLREGHSLNRFTRMGSCGVGALPFTTPAPVFRNRWFRNQPATIEIVLTTPTARSASPALSADRYSEISNPMFQLASSAPFATRRDTWRSHAPVAESMPPRRGERPRGDCRRYCSVLLASSWNTGSGLQAWIDWLAFQRKYSEHTLVNAPERFAGDEAF